MEGEVVIKDEPLDYDETETFIDYNLMPIDHVKVEYENNSYANNAEKVPPYYPKNEKLKIITENSNLITVYATEAIQNEDQLNLIEKITPEADHSYVPFTSERQIKFKLPRIEKYSLNKEQNFAQFECRRNCDRKFKTLTERALHESYDHHQTKSRTIKCNFCNKTFDSFFALTRHMPEHRNVHRYVCTHCSKCFDSYKLLQMHRETSAGCNNEQLNTKDTSNAKETMKEDVSNTSYQSNSIAQNASIPKSSLPFELPQAPLLPLQTKKDLSFAEEIKAFAAKYQLKSSSVVAKKRTSPMIILPTKNKRRKNSKSIQCQKFETVSQYAVPNAIGPLNSGPANPIINVKVKEEPLDQYDEQFPIDTKSICTDEIEMKCELFSDIQVKNEPIDDSPEELIETTVTQNDMESKYSSVSTPYSDISYDETNDMDCLRNINVDFSNSTCFDGIPSPSLESPKVNEDVVNSSSIPMKTIKILKLAPNFRIIKLPITKLTPIKNENSTQSDEIEKFEPSKLPFPSPQIKHNTTENTKNTTVSIETAKTIKHEVKEENSLPKKRTTLPRNLLRCIESQPQTMKIIEDFQRKIEEAENTDAVVLNFSKIKHEKSADTDAKNVEMEMVRNELMVSEPETSPPPSVYMSAIENNYSELWSARRKHKKYRFSWMCQYCPARYEHKGSCVAHLIRVHKILPEDLEKLIIEVRPFRYDECNSIDNKEKKSQFLSYSKYRCPNCLRTCSSRTMLNDHIAGNCGRVRLYQCNECPKAFYSKNTLNYHRSIHTGEMPYKCDYCDKRFRTPGQVRVHHRSHTGERPFACQVCTQRFAHRETLISHLSRHIGMKRYRCYACGKHFSCVSGLKTHHDLRPDTCGRVKLNTRAVGPRVRVIRGQVHFEPQPELNPYLRTEDPQDILAEIQNIPMTGS